MSTSAKSRYVSPRPDDSPYLTADEAAAFCRRSKKTLLNHKAQGRLRAVAGTRPPLFRIEDLKAWISGSSR
ncbi:MAG: helix-turn-helix domain-containing protein [Fimbriiglobus sp.]